MAADDLWQFAGPGEGTGFVTVTLPNEPQATGGPTTVVVEPTESGGTKTTTTTPGAAGTLQPASVVVTSTEGLQTQREFENPLHEYASYTYNISLHMISIDTYNRIINNNFVNNAPTPYIPENVLISGAGRYNDVDFKRNKYFKEDFYFEDFRMQTVVTPNMRNRNTNMIECSFTIIEPNGFTLINRMIAAANEINKNFIGAPESYIKIPYVLQIDFFGYKEQGDAKPEKIKDLTKIIPICLVNVETQVRQSGAEYKVEAVAFNHQVFSQIYNAIPFHTTISAKTVAAAFNTGANDSALTGSLVTRQQRQEYLQREINQTQQIIDNLNAGAANAFDFYDLLDQQELKLSNLKVEENNLINTSINASGICVAINSYYEALVKLGTITYNTKFRVEFDPEIAASELFSGPMPVPTPGAATTNSKQTGRTATSLAFTAGTINIPPGTTLTNLIDFVVRNSKYIQDQITLPDQQAVAALQSDAANGRKTVEELITALNKPLKWYKIVPTLKVGKWDNKLKRFTADTVTLYVRTFTISSKYPYASRGRVPGYVKKYDYLFTGRNRDVIDWHINFNTLYLLAVTGNLNKVIQDDPAKGLNPAGLAATPGTNTSSSSVQPNANSVAAPGIVVTAGNSDTIVLGGNPQKSQASADLANSILTDSRGDMIELELKILGDPHFIKQDDVFYSRPGANQSAALTPNKSLYMDTGELYIFVNFISPVDYNEEKGLAEIKANEILGSNSVAAKSLGYSNFSGVYKLITVDSVLSRGKFEQTLRLAKILFDQTGQSINDSRLEQNSQLSLTLGALSGAGRINTEQSVADIVANDAFIAINSGIGQITGAITDAAVQVVGRVTQSVIDRGIAAIRNSTGSVSEGISISDQPEGIIYASVTPEIIDIGFGDTTGALG